MLSCQRCAVLFLLFLYPIWAISVFGVGVFLVLHHSPQSALFGEQLLQNIGYGFLIAGGILLLSVIHGCSIVCCRGKILTISFVVCLLILASILFFVGGFTIYKRFQIRDSLRNEMEHRFTMNYGFDLALTNAWDSTQWSYHCCGVAGPETYASSRWIRDPSNLSPRSSGLVPDSCCKRYDNQTYVNLDGCYISPLQEAEPFLYVHNTKIPSNCFITTCDVAAQNRKKFPIPVFLSTRVVMNSYARILRKSFSEQAFSPCSRAVLRLQVLTSTQRKALDHDGYLDSDYQVLTAGPRYSGLVYWIEVDVHERKLIAQRVVFSVVLLCRFCGPHAVWV
ncbi:hypothetical protein FGIG_04999 [Fasciola gigantica]|uniref:Tetraspanin n=1 Tax=Fasciola gigantica TaxID=46835 RepID=A0A504YCV8_FASGI|nr:hypothetical protein FGIG_04999 [Fasciola gigantica]